MGTTPSVNSAALASFNGTSQYAADLQQAITQAVTIASIPLSELENNVSSLQSQSSEVSTLQSDFTALQTAVQSLSSTSGSNSLSGKVSDDTVATVSVDGSTAVAPGTYSLNVISAGSPTSTLSAVGLTIVTDPSTGSISSSNTFTLSVGGSTFQVSPATNTLNALAEAINSAGLGVSATVVNIGPSSAPDYRLSLQSTTLGDENIQLNDGTQNLLTILAHGAAATYQVDGQPAPPSAPISSSTSTVTLAPGVTANLVGTGETTVTVAPDSSGAANALSAFATAYNSALAELDNNHGTAGGALTGQSITFELEQALRNLTQFTGGSGSVQNLSNLGLTFSQSGQLSFDQATFDNAASTDPNDVASFLGTATSGGFLENATNVLTELTNTSTGLFAATNNSYQSQITSDNQQITDQEARITTMQNNLTAQMAQADTLIATLESQVNYYTNYFTDTRNAISSGG
jgi:flagellar hook-associated protein 2